MDGGERSAAGRVIPARPARDVRLDIVRGWLQLSIFASHTTGSVVGAWLIHGAWGFSDSSEQFIFLSGFTLGSVFARKEARDGWGAAARDLLRRTWRLYRIHMMVFVLFLGAVALAGATVLPGEFAARGFGPVLADPWHAVPGAVLMVFQPDFMGILPSFVWCMLLLPGFAWVMGRVGVAALVLPVALYAAVQGGGLMLPALPVAGGIAFNPFAWQVLYLVGAWLGARALHCGRALDLPTAWDRTASVVAVGLVVGGVWVKLAWMGVPGLPAPDAMTTRIDWKPDLAPLRVVHAFALAWLVARFVPRAAWWMDGVAGRWMARIGRSSLEVFCVGIFLSWGVASFFRLASPMAGRVLDVPLFLLGCAALGRFAAWKEQRDVRG